MAGLTAAPDKGLHKRRVRRRVPDPNSPREVFANPKYGRATRNFIFRVTAMKKDKPASQSDSPVCPDMEPDPFEEDDIFLAPLPVNSFVPEQDLGTIDLHMGQQKTQTPCQKVYQRACAKLGVRPCTNVHDSLPQPKMALPHNGVGQQQVKAVAIALVHNATVHKLNMTDNRLGAEGTDFITQTLKENTSLTDLNLSSNDLGREGVRLVAGALLTNTTIVRVNLSANNIQDNDTAVFTQMLKVNRTLRTLDVSWNHLRMMGGVALCRALAKNQGLTHLLVSWNGLSVAGCRELGTALTTNTVLQELDLSTNRLNAAACRPLLEGLRHNTTLRCLRLGTNPITTDIASSILTMLSDDLTGLTELDLKDVLVDDNFLTLLRRVHDKRPLAVRHGVALRHDGVREGQQPTVIDTDDPATLLFDLMRHKNLRLIDLLRTLNKDNRDTLTREELRDGLLNNAIPLSSRSMDLLMDKLDLNRDGHVDYEELTIGLKDYLRKTARWKRRMSQLVDSLADLPSSLQELRDAVRRKST